jgi:hypothetical protein
MFLSTVLSVSSVSCERNRPLQGCLNLDQSPCFQWITSRIFAPVTTTDTNHVSANETYTAGLWTST